MCFNVTATIVCCICVVSFLPLLSFPPLPLLPFLFPYSPPLLSSPSSPLPLLLLPLSQRSSLLSWLPGWTSIPSLPLNSVHPSQLQTHVHPRARCLSWTTGTCPFILWPCVRPVLTGKKKWRIYTCYSDSRTLQAVPSISGNWSCISGCPWWLCEAAGHSKL